MSDKAISLLALATFALFNVTEALSQGMPPENMRPPSLEPTIKLYPAPKVRPEKSVMNLPAQCVCTMQYEPVCARTRDGNRATYSNACRARCVGATVIMRGRC